MSFKKKHAEAVKAALEISKRYDGKDMLGDDEAKFKSLVEEATKFKTLAQEEEALVKMQSELANGEVETEGEGKRNFSGKEKEAKKENFFQQLYGIAKYGRGPQAPISQEAMEQFLHKEGDVSVGGAFVPVDFDSTMSQGLADFTSIRPNVTVRNTKGLHYEFPRIKGAGAIYPTDYVSTSWKGEGMDISDNGAAITAQSTPTTQLVRITVKLWAQDPIVITREMMSDAPSFEADLKKNFGTHLGLELDDAYLNGNGVIRPRGILTYAGAGITTVNSGSISAVTYNGLIDLMVALPPQYHKNAKFYMNMSTYGSMLKLAGSTNDHPFFAPGLLRGELWSKDIVISPFMPAIASASNSILFADLSYYRAVDRQDMEVIRLVERYAPHVALIPFGRFGGDVEEFQAFRIQKFSV